METNPSLKPEIGPDGLPREAPVIAYTEKIIEEEQLQVKKYIEENYSKIRDVERELENLTMEVKLTAGPKKAALELLRKKIEMSTERIRAAKLKEEQARKAWEVASKDVLDEEALKRKLCEDLNQLVQESSSSQFTRLEELKRRLEALNPGRASTSIPLGGTMIGSSTPAELAAGVPEKISKEGSSGHISVPNGGNQQQLPLEVEGKGKKKNVIHGRGKGIGAMPKSRGHSMPGWTGAGFDIDGRS